MCFQFKRKRKNCSRRWFSDKNLCLGWEFKQLNTKFKTKRFTPFRLACTDARIIVYNNPGNRNGNYLIYDLNGKFIDGITDRTLSIDGFIDSGTITANKEHVYFASEGKPDLKKYNYLKDKPMLIKAIIETLDEENNIETTSLNKYEVATKRSSNFKYQSRGTK